MPFLFHTEQFVYRNSNLPLQHFQVDDHSIYFAATENKLISLTKSPFGGFVIPQEELDLNKIKRLIEKAVTYATENNFKSIEIRNCPEIYSSKKLMETNQLLLSLGWVIKYKDTTQVLLCNEPFKPVPSRKRRINQCAALGFLFQELSKNDLPEAYELFLQSRANKGYPVTMQLHDLNSEFEKFPDHYKLFAVREKQKMVAAAVTVLVNEELLYYFFAGDDLSYRKQSPSSFLIFNLFEWATTNNFKLIDLGISTENGVLNNGLYDFKKSFGALDSPKLTFELSL
ncbi:MAG: GNAT family N-acetyltransferase [Bacteroidetes bacterium]|nr:GNAT family N-acetyltransferase [Bacteroidota bacterium]